ncbi:MAG: tetratricopeptide repeat protein [Phycisphaerales bacterium]|nr:MAG: tetratricopeptide repeat protein [Phycisphaerales bacterium]
MSDRISRKRSSTGSTPSAPSSGRIDRRYYSYSDHPHARRSLYHYHRHHYPSSRIFYWISWPDCCHPICYPWGPHYTFGYFWPYYHRRFVFVSIGGYWPDYPYRRYYWYGCHPYRWYGYYPPGYVIAGPTYNYYYYNDEPRGEALEKAHRKLEESPPAKPASETQTDRYFDQAVKAFEAGDYAAAAEKFHEAQKLAPDDIVLPFARVQALFAAGQYNEAAVALREALVTASPDKEGVFYPRGLYCDDKILSQQIEQLSRAVQLNPADSDLRLLLGYQLLGVGKPDEAADHLQIAKQQTVNNQAATTLMDLLQKIRKPGDGDSDVEEQQPDSPKPQESVQPNDGSAKALPTQKRHDIDMVALAMAADNWLAAE